MTEWSHLIQQSITAGQQSSISRVEQNIQFSLPQQSIYFDMEIVETVSHMSSSEKAVLINRENLQKIKPGEYHLRVHAKRERYYGQYLKEEEIIIAPDIELELSYMASTDVMIRIENPLWQISASDSVLSLRHIFKISIFDECPSCELLFALRYQYNMKHTQNSQEDEDLGKRMGTSLKVMVDGTYNADNIALLEICKVALDTPLPEQTAILHVQQCNQDKLQLLGWNRRGSPLETGPIDRLSKSLAEFIKQKVGPELAIKAIREFSRKSPERLKVWLIELLKRYSEQLCLVIADHTDFETPWEMLEVGDEKYLGARAMIVRWTNVAYPIDWSQPAYWHKLKMVPEQRHGSVIAYLDDKELEEKHTYAERRILGKLKVKQCTNLSELVELLSDAELLKGIGLIYLGCHGHDGRRIGSKFHSTGYIDAVELELPIVHPHPRPIFFVNACDSGRLKKDYNSSFSGLVEIILARYADGYIGTLGQVGSAYASLIAENILKDASTLTDGIQVANKLRRLRAEAAERATRRALLTVSSEEKVQRETELIYTFMYIYYGNGMTQLQLEGKERVEYECE